MAVSEVPPIPSSPIFPPLSLNLPPSSPIQPALAPNPSPVLSLTLSPPELEPLDLRNYLPIPGRNTVVHHPPFNLPSMGIVINLHFRCVICLKCERAVNPSTLIEHLRQDFSFLEIPENLSSVLETTYHLIPYSSAVYTPHPILPVFGIPLQSSPIYFCACGKGYSSLESLRPHQTRVGVRECPLRKENPSFHRGYGQRLTGNKGFFEVDPSKWRLDNDAPQPYPLAFCRSLPPLRDYSQMEIKGAEDEMNTSSFFYTQRWLKHLEGYSPEDIQEVLLPSTAEAPFGDRLRQIAELFLEEANSEIPNHQSFGILKLMGQTTEYVIFFIILYIVIKFCYLGGKPFIASIR